MPRAKRAPDRTSLAPWRWVTWGREWHRWPVRWRCDGPAVVREHHARPRSSAMAVALRLGPWPLLGEQELATRVVDAGLAQTRRRPAAGRRRRRSGPGAACCTRRACTAARAVSGGSGRGAGSAPAGRRGRAATGSPAPSAAPIVGHLGQWRVQLLAQPLHARRQRGRRSTRSRPRRAVPAHADAAAEAGVVVEAVDEVGDLVVAQQQSGSGPAPLVELGRELAPFTPAPSRAR